MAGENSENLLDSFPVPVDTFEDFYCCRLYEDRMECITCKNIICCKCYWHFENHELIDGEVPGFDCPIICPFCRQKDYKIFYQNRIPYELLNEIKNRS